jgi:hypothetical protein
VAVCAFDPKPGQEHELPLTATGWTTGRFVLDLIERMDRDARPTGCAEAGFEGSVELKLRDVNEFTMLVETGGCHRVMGVEARLMGTVTAGDAALVRQLADRPE